MFSQIVTHLHCSTCSFIDYIPEDLRESHRAVRNTSENNECLYASASMLLWGNADHVSKLKLASIVKVVVEFEDLVHEVETSIG